MADSPSIMRFLMQPVIEEPQTPAPQEPAEEEQDKPLVIEEAPDDEPADQEQVHIHKSATFDFNPTTLFLLFSVTIVTDSRHSYRRD